MNFIDTIKGLIFKQPGVQHDAQPTSKPSAGNSENPYLSARREWNDHVGSIVSSRQTWQIIGLLCLMIALAAVGGIIYIGSQSKFIPYVVQVDKQGQTISMGTAITAAKADPRIIHATVADFISSARMVTVDVALQRKAIFKVFAFLSPNDPASAKMKEWFSGGGNPDKTPFARASKELVDVEIKSVIPQTPDTWQVDWDEAVRDNQGTLKNTINMRALVTVYTTEPTTETTDEQLRQNPLGIYVKDFSWAHLL